MMCKACPGCNLANLSLRRSADLVYSFPIEAPMLVLHVDIYTVGVEQNFEGTQYYLIASCGMTGFSVCEDTPKQSAESFAAALMKIWLRFGFSHTIVVDKDSKFRATFEQTAALLKINIHVLSGGNHDPMLVERVIRYLNKALKIFCTERGTVKVALEAILLSLYAWNSAPVPATDLSRSLLTIGREFQFTIDFCLDKHRSLVSTPDRVISFAKEQAKLLSASRFL